MIAFEAFTLIWRDALGVEALEIVIGEGTNWLTDSIHELVLRFADANVWSHARLVNSARWITLWQATEIIHGIVARIALTFIVPFAISVHAKIFAVRNAFRCDSYETITTFRNRFVILVMMWR